MSGGGTAGHITPTLHVARALRRSDPDLRLSYVIEKGSRFRKLVDSAEVIDSVHPITAGKWRRYHGVSFISRLLDIKTNTLNLVDLFKTIIGTLSMCFYFIRHKPDVVFAKGGYVVVPVGLAARVFGVPIITHDSDLSPGLANKIIGRWAILRTVATETAANAYNNERTSIVGIPIDELFSPATPQEKKAVRKQLGLNEESPSLLITGGSLGAQKLNEAMKEAITRIVADISNVHILWVVGQNNFEQMLDWHEQQSSELKRAVDIRGFITDMPLWFKAVDVVISRGGATALAEIVAAQKPSVIVPACFLPGGHQLDNARNLHEQNAAVVVIEQNDVRQFASELAQKAVKLLSDEATRNRYSLALSKLPQTNTAAKLAEIIIGAMK